MTHRSIRMLFVLLLLLSACAQSRVDPDADIRLQGAVRHQDGTPVAGAKVVFTIEPDLGEVFWFLTSVGLACLDRDISPVCEGARIETTGDDGAFAYELKGRDVQGTVGTASTVELATRLDRATGQIQGPTVTKRFLVQTTELSLPLQAWEPEVGATAEGGDVRVSWSSFPPDLLPSSADVGSVATAVRFERIDELVWEFDGVQPETPLDLRLLEDTTGGMAVVAHAEDLKVDDASGDQLTVFLRSARYAYRSPAGAPPSRRVACSVPGTDGAAVAQASCRLTDGNFAVPFDPRTCPEADDACAEPNHTEVTIDLGRPVDATLVAVRGCPGQCSVEMSEDGSSYRLMGSGGGDNSVDGNEGDIALAPPEAVRGRFVRVRSEGGIDTLREVSVWDPTPVRAAGEFLTREEVEPGTTDTSPDDGDASPRSVLPWAAAAVLAAVVGAVTVYLTKKKRRPTT